MAVTNPAQSIHQSLGPIARLAGGAIVQWGWDQVESLVLALPLTAADAQFPRVIGTPLQVSLFGVTPGNLLYVDFSGSLLTQGPNFGLGDGSLVCCPIVSFLPSAVFPGEFDIVQNAGCGVRAKEAQADDRTMRGTAMVVIPGGVNQAVVRVVYSTDVLAGLSFTTAGTLGKSYVSRSICLHAAEFEVGSVTDAGPSTLVPL